MNAMKLTAAVLAAGGALGAAATAQATTVDLNISGLADPTDITLVPGSGTQFNYGLDASTQKSFFTPEQGALVSKLSPTYVDPYSDSTYKNSGVKTGKNTIGKSAVSNVPSTYQPTFEDAYANLKFSAGGVDYIGTAHFKGDDANLETISFDVSGAPEPQAWALLIMGVGVAGAAMRRRAQRAVTA